MTGTSSRTLQLLGLLQSRRHWIGTDLADRLDVSLRTLRRDVDRLRELGYPVQADRGVGGGYQLAHGASLPPLVLDHDEAVSVTIGLLNCAHTPVAGVAEASARALAKVIPVMPPRLCHEVTALQAATAPTTSPWSGTDINPDDMVTVAQACRDSERLRFNYTAADGAQSHRRVEPAQLVTLGRHWYLVGFDLDRDDWRTFRLDRLSDATSTRQIVQPREVPGGDAAAFVEAGLRHDGVTVTAELDAPADEVRERTRLRGTSGTRNGGAVTEIDNSRCRITLERSTLDWAAFILGNAGAQVLTADPPELVDLLHDLSARFAGAVPGDTASTEE